jgi:hypothetical protein
MRQILILFIILISTYSYADIKRDTLCTSHSGHSIENDTIIHKGLLTITTNQTEKKNDSTPWIVALIIGLTSAFVNVIIAILQQKGNKRNIERQLDNANETISKQINSAKDIAILDFNRSVKSQNRMDWINAVRDTCSGMIANLESFNVEFINAKLIGKSREFKLNQKYTIEISRLATKLELLLNPKEDKTITALGYLKSMSEKIINDKTIDENYDRNAYKLEESKFLDTIKLILKEEWERVKSGI